jgi:hypothetical protein
MNLEDRAEIQALELVWASRLEEAGSRYWVDKTKENQAEYWRLLKVFADLILRRQIPAEEGTRHKNMFGK